MLSYSEFIRYDGSVHPFHGFQLWGFFQKHIQMLNIAQLKNRQVTDGFLIFSNESIQVIQRCFVIVIERTIHIVTNTGQHP